MFSQNNKHDSISTCLDSQIKQFEIIWPFISYDMALYKFKIIAVAANVAISAVPLIEIYELICREKRYFVMISN